MDASCVELHAALLKRFCIHLMTNLLEASRRVSTPAYKSAVLLLMKLWVVSGVVKCARMHQREPG